MLNPSTQKAHSEWNKRKQETLKTKIGKEELQGMDSPVIGGKQTRILCIIKSIKQMTWESSYVH